MKVTLVVLGFACFVGALSAFPLEEINESEFELVPQVLPNFEEEDIIPENFPSFEDAFPPRPETPRPPQIHHNDIKIQAPFSGRLVNVVSNDNGLQETLQRNKIHYNFNGVKKTLEKLLKEQQNE